MAAHEGSETAPPSPLAAAAASSSAAAASVHPLLAAHKVAATGPGGVALGEHHGGNFGVYYEHKKAKLAEQYTAAYGGGGGGGSSGPAEGDTSTSPPQLFRGVRVWINGYTDPPVDELKLLMGRGGGVVDHYLSSAVTHIVATNLPDSKIKQIREMRRWMPVVTPAWVVHSAAAGRLLDVASFLLPAFREGPRSSLSAAFAAAAAAVAPAAAVTAAAAPATLQQSRPPLTLEPPPPPPPPAAGGGEEGRARTAGNDPAFMESYFASSRLHFIGSFRAAVQSIVAAGQHAPPPPPPLPLPPPDAPTPDGTSASLPTSAPVALPQPAGASWPRVIAHVDVDCFFAQVALLSAPHLVDKPVVVAHGGRAAAGAPPVPRSGGGGGTDTAGDVGPGGGRGGEVSSANYPARAFGIHAGMNVAAAVALCPHLVVLPYDFERITVVSEAIFRHFLAVTPTVEALSCDEAYLDLSGVPAPLERIARLRADILAATGCTVSAGVGPNMLLARLATGRAKPNGMYVVPPDAAAVTAFMLPLDASVLPGVGWASRAKLEARGVRTVAQLREVPRGELESLFGPVVGARLWAAAHGTDDRVVRPTRTRKSVGAEVNWGVRFADAPQARDFLRKLCGEVASRLAAAGREVAVALAPPPVTSAIPAGTAPPPPPPLRGRCITLSVMVRQAGAGAPWKYMGHGACDTHTRSVTRAAPTAAATAIADAAMHLYNGLGVDATQVRGVGVHVSKLEMPAGASAGGDVVGVGAAGSAGVLARFLRQGGARDGSGGSSGGGGGHAAGSASIVVVDDDEDDVVQVVDGSDIVTLLSPPDPPLPQTPPVLPARSDAAHVTDSDVACAEEELARQLPPAAVTAALRPWLRSVGAYPSGGQARRLAAYACALLRHDADAAAVFCRTLTRHAADIADEAAAAAAALATGAVTSHDLPPSLLAAWAAPPSPSVATLTRATWTDAAAFVIDEVQRACLALRGVSLYLGS